MDFTLIVSPYNLTDGSTVYNVTLRGDHVFHAEDLVAAGKFAEAVSAAINRWTVDTAEVRYDRT